MLEEENEKIRREEASRSSNILLSLEDTSEQGGLLITLSECSSFIFITVK